MAIERRSRDWTLPFCGHMTNLRRRERRREEGSEKIGERSCKATGGGGETREGEELVPSGVTGTVTEYKVL